MFRKIKIITVIALVGAVLGGTLVYSWLRILRPSQQGKSPA